MGSAGVGGHLMDVASDVVGHSHRAMMGFATFAAAGGLVHVWQRLGHGRYNASALEWSFWLLTGGVVVMVADLTVAGLVQASLWQSNAPWIDAVAASQPYWLVRTLSAIPISAGFVMLLLGLTTGPRGGGVRTLAHIGAGRAAVVAPRLSVRPVASS